MMRILFLSAFLALPLGAEAKVISHRENVAIRVLHAETALTCFTNDFDHEIGEVRLAAAAVHDPAVLNGHEYAIELTRGAAEACDKVVALLRDAPPGHPGTGRYLDGVASSTLDLGGGKLTEDVTVTVSLPGEPGRALTFQSRSIQALSPPSR